MIPGKFVQSLLGYSCFVPNPLPPSDLKLSVSTLRLIEETTHALGKVDACRSILPNPDLLKFASLQLEAIASSTIENTVASAEEVILFQATHHAGREQVREVSNYGKALEQGVDLLAQRPISVNLLLEIHETLLLGVRGAVYGGKFKIGQNYIAQSKIDPIEKATFVPPPPEMTPQLMADLEKYINLNETEPKLVQIALTHYQFETIHPFADGNGRVGRLLIVLQLMQSGLVSAPLLYPSVYFEKTRDEYYTRLQTLRETADWEGWIKYFVEGLKYSAGLTISMVEAIHKVQRELRGRFREVRRQASLGRVLEAFCERPVMSVQAVSDMARVSFVTAQSAIKELEEEGILREMTGQKRSRLYSCTPILDVLFADN